MKFHPSQCKALAVTLQRNVLDNLPFNIYHYMLGSSFIDNELSQRDLGVIITTKLYWSLDNLIAKASSRLALLMRTCHFTTNFTKKQKRSFYLALVRSTGISYCKIRYDPEKGDKMDRWSPF